jgi:hypothetical protein
MPQKVDERIINLALKALQNDPKLSARAAGKIYNCSHLILSRRRRGILSRRDISANSRNLTDREESVLLEYILNLAAKGFPPRLSFVEDMASRLRAQRGLPRVGTRWASHFVKRHPELRTRFQRKYDYQRALCEDPKLISKWFEDVQCTISKYGICVEDIYNFDETGFMMGQISQGMVVTSSLGYGKAKKIQPGNREWVTVIAAVSSQGWNVPPFVIVAGKNHLASWYESSGFPPDWKIAVTSNGWTTNEVGLDWIQHFDKHTQSRTIGAYRLLVLDGHESHHSEKFEYYCMENNIITLCMPAHSSHLLQPLDVGCFSPLKKAYSQQVEDLMRDYVMHITKDDFFPAFHAAYDIAMTESNIQGGFRGAGLVPLDPKRVLSKLDLMIRTPTPSNSRPTTAQDWTSQTPKNPIEAVSQSTLIKSRIASHQNSSPTSIYQAVDQIEKGAQLVMHRLVFLEEENRRLRAAQILLSKRRKAKKTRIQEGGSLSQQESQEIVDERDVVQQIEQETRASTGRKPRVEARSRRCGTCHKVGHNARSCSSIVVDTENEDSE